MDESKMTTKTPEEIGKRLKAGFESDCPKVYVNSFVTGVGVGDMVVVAEHNGRPSAVLNLSFTTAKTLAISLSEAVAKIEESTGQTMLTTGEIEKAMANDTAHSKSE